MVKLREGGFSLKEVIDKMRSPKVGAIVTYIEGWCGASPKGEKLRG